MRRIVFVAAVLAFLASFGHTVFRRPFGRVASMDPIRAADVLAAEAVAMVYEPLLEVDYKARPYRLKECVCELPSVSKDGLVYTFKVADGRNFRNGEPVTAADIKRCLDRLADKSNASPGMWTMAGVKSVEAVDIRTVRITLKKPSHVFTWLMAMPFTGVVAEDGSGSGAYWLKSWRKNHEMVFSRNESYREPVAIALNIDEEYAKLAVAAEYLAPFVTDTVVEVNKLLKAGKKVLCEGAQGTLLDVDHGTYPYVTSSSTVSGGACTGAGIAPKHIGTVWGVVKAYTTRVGEGPFPTELFDADGEELRRIGREFGATTGRPRRCGWFDAVATRYSCMINGVDKMAITKLDVLDTMKEIKVCVGYDIDGKVIDYVPSDVEDLAKVKPVYNTVPGWNCSTENVTCYADLPENAKRYLDYLAELVDSEVAIVSVGPKREQTFEK